MSIKALIFDLDDTVYPEYEFVFSGYRAVGLEVEKKYGLNISESLIKKFCEGQRGDLFTPVLLDAGVTDVERYCRSVLVPLYRNHMPSLRPYAGFTNHLPFFRSWHLALLTDGFALTQQNKIKSLGVEGIFSKIVVTGSLGVGYSKPHPMGYELILRELNVDPASAIYIADNIAKDFIYPRQCGMKSIRLLNKDENKYLIYENAASAAQPDFECATYLELVSVLSSLR